MPTDVLIKPEHQVLDEPPNVARQTRPDELRIAAVRYAARVRRLKFSVAAWAVWTISITSSWGPTSGT